MRPRIRTIKPEFWQDEKIGALSRDARVLLVGLVTMADDEGRLRAMPAGILGHVYPYDEDAPRKLSRWLDEVQASEILLGYEHAGVRYLAFRHWRRHQAVTRPSASTLPVPPDPQIAADNAIPERELSGEVTRGAPGYKKAAIPEAVRRAVAKANGGVPGQTVPASCASCGASGEITWPRRSNGKPGSWVTFSDLELDHIDPEVAGGAAVAENIQLLCRGCNRSKGSRTQSRKPVTDPGTSGHGIPHAQARVPLPSDPDPVRQEPSRTRTRGAVDQDALPDDFPEHLVDRVEPVMVRLRRVQTERGGQVPTRRGVGLAIRRFPGRDHVAVADELEHWSLAGRGMSIPTRDWAQRYGNFLDHAADACPVRLVPKPGQPGSETAERHARQEAALERVLARGSA